MRTAEFHLFDTDHIAVLLLLIVLGTAIIWAGRRRRPEADRWLSPGFGLVLAAYAIARYSQIALGGQLSWDYALPLELCHWVLIACLVALFFRSQLAAEVAYFWGLGGTLQAVLTPDLADGFPSWEFIQFFWAHGAVLLAIVFLIAVRRFRPRRGSVLRMMLAANVYLGVAGSVDLIFRWNYGYLRHPPSHPSLIDYLGPWPWYILSLELVALASFWLLDLPWRLFRRRGQASDAPSSAVLTLTGEAGILRDKEEESP